MMKVEILKLK